VIKAFADFEQYDALGLAELVKDGKVLPGELLEAAIERVESRNGAINAVTVKLYDYARNAIASGLPEGPFKGVPFLLKDIAASLAGARMTRGSRFFADMPPAAIDTEHVRRLKRSGLVIFGRTNTCELGLSLTCEPQLHGPTTNPWDTTRISGGSSGGAAAAVSARMLPMAHGSDGFGSIRAPAACCGIVGLKPTRGRNTAAPDAGERFAGCSIEHAVTLTIRDTAALLDATAGSSPGDPYVAPMKARPYIEDVRLGPGSLRIAYTKVAPNGAPIDVTSLKTLNEVVALCKSLGHKVEEADPEIDGAAVVPTFLTIAAANTTVALASHPTAGRSPRKGEVENITWRMGQKGDHISAADYVRATQAAHRLGREMAAFHVKWDVLLTPALGTLPPQIGWIDMMMEDLDEYWRRVFFFSPFTVLFNLTGQPALVLPLGSTPEGFPAAVQFAGRYGDEGTILALGAQLEMVRPWFDKKPPMGC